MSEILKPLTEVSKTGNGYVELPGGLIFQWGSYSGAAGDFTVTFPIPFQTAALNVTMSSAATQQFAGDYNSQWLRTLSASGFTGYKVESQSVFWFAIGH